MGCLGDARGGGEGRAGRAGVWGAPARGDARPPPSAAPLQWLSRAVGRRCPEPLSRPLAGSLGEQPRPGRASALRPRLAPCVPGRGALRGRVGRRWPGSGPGVAWRGPGVARRWL